MSIDEEVHVESYFEPPGGRDGDWQEGSGYLLGRVVGGQEAQAALLAQLRVELNEWEGRCRALERERDEARAERRELRRRLDERDRQEAEAEEKREHSAESAVSRRFAILAVALSAGLSFLANTAFRLWDYVVSQGGHSLGKP